MNGQVKAGQGCKTIWDTLEYLVCTFLKQSLHEQEAEALRAMLECGKAGDAAIKARTAFEVKKDTQQKEFAEMIRSWHRYIRSVDAAAAAPRSKLATNVDFSSIMSKQDAVVLDAWSSAAMYWSGKLLDGAISLDLTMEAGLGWKDAVTDDMTIEQISEVAEPTLMSVKGRKLTSLKDSLLEAGGLLTNFCCWTS